MEPVRVRLDKWLWAARFFKTRSAAAQAIEGGKVKLGEQRTKPAHVLRVGERLSIQIGSYEWRLTVRALSDRRGPAVQARALYEEDEASRSERLELLERRRAGLEHVAVPGGRPSKRQQRRLVRIRGY